MAKLFNFRGISKWDSEHEMFVAYCLETGSTATTDESREEAMQMLYEVLEDEVQHAIKHKNLTNLFSAPLPLDFWKEWLDGANSTIPYAVEDSEKFSLSVVLGAAR